MTSHMNRRQFVAGSAGAAAALSLAAGWPGESRAADNVVKIGWAGAMTGILAAWGLPGVYGCQLWAEMINAEGGVKAGGDAYRVEIVPYDNEFDPTKSVAGAKKLVLEDEVKFLVGMYSTPVTSMQPFLTQQKILNSSLAPLDMSPDWPYLIAVSEEYPFDAILPTAWLLEQRPEIKKVSICSTNEESVLQGLAGFRALFEVKNVEIVNDQIYGSDTMDFAPIVSAMLAAKPDLMCWGVSYPDFVNLLCQQAYVQGWRGPMSSFSASNYEAVIQKTSTEFMEGYTFGVPNYDDPLLQGPEINFPNPAEFQRIYKERWPESWGEAAWLYPMSLAVWKSGVEAAGSIESSAVYEALRSMEQVPHTFGPAIWYGKNPYGIDNALAGRVPAVQIQDSKPKIMAMVDIPPWIDEHMDVFVRHMQELQLI